MASAPAAADATGALELCGLRCSFGEIVAADGLSVSVPAACVMGFAGRNRTGKTTRMRIVCVQLSADGGRVMCDGAPIGGWARERIVYMPEERGLCMTMRVADQLECFAVLHGATNREARRAVCSWLERLGLGGRDRVRVGERSHGDQQGVQLAAALARGPDLLILDEPFAGLDRIATTDVMVTATDSRGVTPQATSIPNIQSASIAL